MLDGWGQRLRPAPALQLFVRKKEKKTPKTSVGCTPPSPPPPVFFFLLCSHTAGGKAAFYPEGCWCERGLHNVLLHSSWTKKPRNNHYCVTSRIPTPAFQVSAIPLTWGVYTWGVSKVQSPSFITLFWGHMKPATAFVQHTLCKQAGGNHFPLLPSVVSAWVGPHVNTYCIRPKNISSPRRKKKKKEYKYRLSGNDSSPNDRSWHLVTWGPWTYWSKDAMFVVNIHLWVCGSSLCW